tara:strand:- start:1266 stop:1460 length:195 start_codon:yes stop_codon:yes gene_type:complete
MKTGDLVKKTWGSTLKIGDIGIILESAGVHLGENWKGWWCVTWPTRGQNEIIKDDCFEVINESR